MKNLIFLFTFLFIISVKSQKPQVDVVKYKEVTTAQRDAFVVPAGEYWRIYNSTTSQNEFWDGDSWEGLGSGPSGMPHTEILRTDYTALSNPEANDILYFIKEKATHTVGKFVYHGILYGESCWIGTQVEKDALISGDATYFDSICWECTDCPPAISSGGSSITVVDGFSSPSTVNAGSVNNDRILNLKFQGVGNMFAHEANNIEFQGYFEPTDLTSVNQDQSDDVIWINDLNGVTDNDYILISKAYTGLLLDEIILHPNNILRLQLYEGFYIDTRRFAYSFVTNPVTDLVGLNNTNYYCFPAINTGIGSQGPASYTNLYATINSLGVFTENYVTQTSETFTPTLIDVGGGATYIIGQESCSYVETENLVTVTYQLSNITTSGTPTGALLLNVPVAMINTPNVILNACACFYGAGGSTTPTTPVFSYINSPTSIGFMELPSTNILSAKTFNNGFIRMVVSYQK